MDRTFFIATLGCKVNWCDSERIAASAGAAGWRRVDAAKDAAVCVINTCTVTAHADATARKIIRQTRRACPDAGLVVAGCSARVNQAVKGMEAVDAVVAAHGEAAVVAAMDAVRARRSGAIVTHTPAHDTSVSAPRRSTVRTRAFVKVQDGCDQQCAYCIVPPARGAARSVPMAVVLDEVAARAREGCREIVLAGVNLAAYADGATRLPGLMDAVAGMDAVPRIRLSSIEAHAVDDAFLAVMAGRASLMPHLHIPLQSGSARVLRLMNRAVTAEQFLDAARRLCAVRPDATVTTDVIVGFPGETEGDFDDTLRCVRAACCAKVHVFPFSPRPGTPADTMRKERVHPAVIRARERLLLDCARSEAARCRARFVNTPLSVLIENRRNSRFEGFSAQYLRVRTSRSDVRTNDIVMLAVNGTDTEFVAHQ